jgi:AraC-like DNA-binding protein
MSIDPGSETGQRDNLARASGVARLGALPTATGVIARQACARVSERGIEVEPLLKRAGLTLRQIEDARVRLGARNQIRFLNLAADALEDDLLGFNLAQLLDLREIGLLYYVMASSDTLAEALQKGARYSSIANDGVVITCVGGGTISITFSYAGVSRHQDRHQIEYWMTTALRTIRRLSGLHVTPVRVSFIHHRAQDCSEFFEFFGAPVAFDAAADEIAFAVDIGDMPAVDADHYLNRLLTTYCDEALAHQPKIRGSLRATVENAMVPLLPHGKARADEVACRLGWSQRSLSRQLSAEGLTFSDLLEGLRSDLAKRYLADAHLSISQIAWLLGYQEVSAFSHAFKRWTGVTPREARLRAAA